MCEIKINNEIKDNGFICYIPDSVLFMKTNILRKENIEKNQEIILSFNKNQINKKIKINENRKICIIDKLKDKDINIIIIELKLINDDLENQNFLENDYIYYLKDYFKLNDELFQNVINEYNKNEIIITLKIEKKDINKKIYFLDNTDEVYYIENGKNISHHHDNLKELNDDNIEVYINNKKEKFTKYFIPDKIGIYTILLKFKIKMKNCSYMFCECYNIRNINLSSFITDNVTNMGYMFALCNKLSNLDLSSFNTNNVINMEGMFLGCEYITKLNLSSFNTSNVTNMNGMFLRCKNLANLNLSSFNTNNINNAEDMFYECDKLKEIIINKNSNNKIKKEIPKNIIINNI